MLQQLIQDSHARDDREAQREIREEQREIREEQREARRETREAQQEIREQLRAEELNSILSTILSHVKPPPSIPLASPVLSSSTPHSSGSMTSGSSQRSPQQRSPTKEARLRAAFLAAVLSGDNFNIGELSVPFLSTELSPSNELYAHRVVGRGGIGDSKDFEISHDGTQTILLPQTDRKFGLSFFIPLSKNDTVLQHAHSYHGTTTGCLAYPLSKVPEGMKLQIDRIQVSSNEIGNNTPIMLHASLSTILNMNLFTFKEKIESWPDRLLCSVAASGESDNESCIEKELVDVVNDQDGISERKDCDNATMTLLTEVVRKLSSSVPDAGVPTGGSPGGPVSLSDQIKVPRKVKN